VPAAPIFLFARRSGLANTVLESEGSRGTALTSRATTGVPFLAGDRQEQRDDFQTVRTAKGSLRVVGE
jgi:hypothetical protein